MNLQNIQDRVLNEALLILMFIKITRKTIKVFTDENRRKN